MTSAPAPPAATQAPTLTVIATPGDLVKYLLAVGTNAPTLNPHIGSENAWKRWNGWNLTRASGVDATGAPLIVECTHYAAGNHAWSFYPAMTLAPAPGIAWQSLTFPLHVLPAVSIIVHPEWTP